jgi:hypothetical protein
VLAEREAIPIEILDLELAETVRAIPGALA